MIILGDLHGEIQIADKLCKKFPLQTIVQLGDCGVGFPKVFEKVAKLPANFRFIEGNHGDRMLCTKLPNYLGHFGERVIDGKKIFVVGGADSIDKHLRVEGRNWWAYEELSYVESKACLDAWEASNAEILITHDCPQFICENYFNISDRSMTRMLINAMYDVRKPKFHWAGHHHRKFQITTQGTLFQCLDINEYAEIN
jgi:hypothetical protein